MRRHEGVRCFACWARGLNFFFMSPLPYFCISFYSCWVLDEGMPRSQGTGLQNGSIVTGIGKKSTIIHVPKNMSGWISISVCLYSSFKHTAFYPTKKNDIACLWNTHSIFFFKSSEHSK